MSSRSRPRANHNQDADEERRLWKEIKERGSRVDEMVTRSNAIGNEILDVETQQAALLDAGKLSDMSLNEKLENLYRENLKLCDEVQQILEGAAGEANLLDSINILAGLREASVGEQAAAPVTTPRVVSGKRDRPKKGVTKVSTATPVDDAIDELSAAPSPRVAGTRLTKEKSSRAGSIPATREASVKIEDGAESIASSIDTIPAAGKLGLAARIAYKTGDLVLYKHRDRGSEGEGILCRVTAVIGEGKQRRYEIQDVDTDPSSNPTPGPGGKALPVTASGSSFRASINSLMQIPESNDKLLDLPKGKQVLALYPDTTTFYRGEVTAPWKAKDGTDSVQVKFEGEQENIESQPVERKYVLPEK
ncbi:hypothetical protein AMS68_001469 [Peltaster fructicola]|uniref:SGF29 C-terminal domain-containing protein n=1 Tax=Peltaster fructicola TaxID=286661 RepID=A0A6H0XMG9_9PEZI|nr:hypothetical protein AMS68_001469 [Peltaster fructicola]